VIHRDIKPENILLQDGQPVLADFGIALALSRAADDRVTATGLSLGTPQYMSPEQATGAREISRRSDIYSLGAVAYEILVGEPPVTGPTREAILSRIVVEPPRAIAPVRPTVPRALEAAVLKALAKNPVDRFATAASFAAAIDLAVQATGDGAAPVARRQMPARTVTLLVGAMALAAAALVILRRPTEVPAAVWRQLTFTGDTRLAAISPDGESIAYTTRGAGQAHVLVREVQGAAADTIASLAAAYTLEWSLAHGRRPLRPGHHRGARRRRHRSLGR
jgi:serine/threonine-protein kinase